MCYDRNKETISILPGTVSVPEGRAGISAFPRIYRTAGVSVYDPFF